MLLTRECDYGIRIIRALAGGEKKPMGEICEAELIPNQYAYKILKKLARGGFLRIARGRDGGYQLVKPLDSFTLYDVITTVDDNLFLNECLKKDNFCPFKVSEEPCIVHQEFNRIQNQLINELRRNTIHDLISQIGSSPNTNTLP